MSIQEPTWPAYNLVQITASDTTVYSPALRQIRVGTAGDLTVVTDQDTSVLFKGCQAGEYIGPFFIKKVMATGSTAADLVGFI